MKKRYIAYGSNMDEGQMAHRCPMARLLGQTEVEGYRLLFKGSLTGAYATIEPQEGGRVPALVWEIGEADEASLDRYEGFPSFYYKKDLTVRLDGQEVTAMVYIMDERRRLPPCGGTGVRRMRLEIRKEELEALRKEYPRGCRVELVRMDDPYREMPPGLKGVVTGVDDSGSIHVDWENGSTLAVVFGEDHVMKAEEGAAWNGRKLRGR